MSRFVRVAPETIRKIIELHQRDKSGRGIAKELGIAYSTVARYIREWKKDPDALRMVWGGLKNRDHELVQEVKRLMLEDPAWLHEQLGWKMTEFYREGWALQEEHQEVLLALPRGAGKSTAFDETRCIVEVLRSAEAVQRRARGESFPRNWIPNISIAIMSAVESIAVGHANSVRMFLERDEIKQIWGPFEGKPWTDRGEFTIAHRDQVVFDPTMLAGGVTSKAWTGKHPDIFVFDDIVVDENVDSLRKIHKLNSRLALKVEGMCKATTRKWWINTPYAKLDPISQRIDAWNGRGPEENKVPSLIVEAIQETENGGHRSYWPEMYPLQDKAPTETEPGKKGLWTKRREMEEQRPGSFDAQYQMDTSKIEERVLDVEKVRKIQLRDVPRPAAVFQSFDAAWKKTPNRKSDFSALATGFFDWSTGRFYLLRCERVRRDPEATKEFIRLEHGLGKEMGWWPKPRTVWIEKTGFYSDKVAGLMHELHEIPFQAFMPRGDKEDRAMPIEHLLSAGRFYVVEGTGDWWQTLRDEMDVFPAGMFDDRVDAVSSLVVRLQREKRRGFAPPSPEPATAASSMPSFFSGFGHSGGRRR